MKSLPGILGVLIFLSGASVHAQEGPEIRISDYDPAQGSFLVMFKEARVELQGARLAGLSAIYRPRSKVESEPEILEADEKGVVVWFPRAAGLVELTAHYFEDGRRRETRKVVSVAFDHPFTWGLVIMVLAGLLLFGGTFVSIRALLASKS